MLFDSITVVGFDRTAVGFDIHTYVTLPLCICSTTTHQIQLQYIEVNYYSTSFLCEALVNKSSFNVRSFQQTVAMCMHMNTHSANIVSKNQISNYLFYPVNAI